MMSGSPIAKAAPRPSPRRRRPLRPRPRAPRRSRARSRRRLSAGAIYRYFDSKGAIVEAIAVERHAHERSLLADALVGEANFAVFPLGEPISGIAALAKATAPRG